MRSVTRESVSVPLLVLLVATLLAGCSAVKPLADGQPPAGGTPTADPGSADVRFADYPSGADFVRSVVSERGNVTITDELRERFNLFARDYRLVHLPDMNGYESFFGSVGYAGALGYTNFADAVLYVLHYMGCPAKMSDEAVEEAVRTLFLAKDGDPEMPHESYRKFATYQDGYYSPWPEGDLADSRLFYLLTAVDAEQGDGSAVNLTVHATSYYFNDTSVYEAGDSENWLSAKARELGVPELEAAARLTATGAISELKGEWSFVTTIRVEPDSRGGLNPRFVSSQRSEAGK